MGVGDDFAIAAAHAEAGRLSEALVALDRVLAAQSDHLGALCARGDALAGLGRRDEALASYDRALALEPRHLPSLVNRGVLLLDLDRSDEALAVFDRILSVNGRVPQAHNNRARALWALDREDEALAAVDAALALDPGYAKAWMNRGGLLRALRHYPEALDAYSAADRLDPQTGQGLYQASLVRLLQGDFDRGWPLYEHRWRTPAFVEGSSGAATAAIRARLDLFPTAEDLAGRRVLVIAEQGIGDELMFCSLLPDLVAVAGTVTWLGDPRLARLLAGSFPAVTFEPAGPGRPVDLDGYERVLAAGSLGHAFRRDLADFPGRPYLTPSSAAVQAWADRLGPRGGQRRIGLSWRGGVKQTNAARRAIPLEALRPILDLPDAEFVSLQYGDAEGDLRRAGLEDRIRLFPPGEIADFDDLAGLVANLDLVISVQTAVVHLAGALGTPALALVPRQPEWRYGAEGDGLAWYRSVRLFRQAADQDWGPVVARVAEAAASSTVV